jgi:hypothetical protein
MKNTTHYVVSGTTFTGLSVGDDEDFTSFAAASREAKRILRHNKAVNAVTVFKIEKVVIGTFCR